MQYVALLLWLLTCLAMAALMQFVMTGALTHRFLQVLAAPGAVVRKLAMAVATLLCGGTVTRVRLYELSSREIDYEAPGASSLANLVVPLTPLFAGAAALTALNAAVSGPLELDCEPPTLASFDGQGLTAYLAVMWGILFTSVRQAVQWHWADPRLYLLIALLFSLAVNAAPAAGRLKEAVLGACLLSAVLAVLSTVAVRRMGVAAGTPVWFAALRTSVMQSAGAAFLMLAYGLLAALPVGVAVRAYEMLSARGGTRRKRAAPQISDLPVERRRAA